MTTTATQPTPEEVFGGYDKNNFYLPPEGKYEGRIAEKNGRIYVQERPEFGLVSVGLEINGESPEAGKWVWATFNTKQPFKFKDDPVAFDRAQTGLGITTRSIRGLEKEITFKDKFDWTTADLTAFDRAFIVP